LLLQLPSLQLLLAAAAILTMSAVHAAGWRGVGEFEDARIRVERHATDGDTVS
jgi:hypothetical protein